MVEQYKRKPNIECSICKTPIYRRPVEISKGRVFCSTACYGIACRKEIPCVACGKMILAGLHKKTCSRACSNKNRAGIQYKIGRPRDKAVMFRTIRLELMKKRGGKCERCGYDKREILHVHHKNRNKLDNRKKNLEIICPNCHYEEHHLGKISLGDIY